MTQLEVSKRPGISPPTWAVQVLQAMKVPVTSTSLYVLDLWSQSEGTQGNGGTDFATGQPRYNWLNSTQVINGSVCCQSCSQGCGSKYPIQDYPDQATGVQATAQTIQGWPSIYAVFREGNADLTNFFEAINTSAPGPCSLAGCAADGNTTYPQALYAALGKGTPTYDPGSTQYTQSGGASGGSSTASSGTGCAAKGCIAKSPSVDLKLFSLGGGCLLNACQGKAIVGGLAIVGGGVILLAGAVLAVVAVGVGKAGPLQKVAEVTGGAYVARQITRRAPAAARSATPSARRARSEAEGNAQQRDRASTIAADKRAVAAKSPPPRMSTPAGPRMSESQRQKTVAANAARRRRSAAVNARNRQRGQAEEPF
jgi:hypothetical protein